MNKHLHNSLRALCLSLAVLLSLPMLAEQVEINGINYDLNTETDQATVIAKSSGEYSGEVVIPGSVEHEGVAYSVTSIGDEAFYSCSLTSVTIPNSVTSIGEHAFYGCYGLPSVSIPNSVVGIGYGAFSGCECLTSIVVEYGNSVYDSRNNCDAIIETATNTLLSGCKTTIIPNSVTSIRGEAFCNCSGLTSVTIPNSVTSIGERAFLSCSGLTSVAIPNSVTSIGEFAFRDCSGLTSVAIGNSVTSIGSYAFQSCSGLTSVAIPNSVTSIGQSAFRDCSGLTSVTIGNSVTSIGDKAFYGCSGLTSVAIPNSVTNIGPRAFSYCSNLHDIYCYAEDVPETESNAFSDSPIASATLHVPAASIDSYKATEPWSGFGNIVGLSNDFNLTVSSAGYATLYLDFNAEIPAAVQAYTGVKVVGNRLKMERVEGVLPANTGVIIKAEEGTYTFAESDATPATIGDNLLYGTVATTQISTDPTYSYYVLSKVDGIVGMYLAKLTDGKFQNNANKAYMMLKKGDLGIYDEGVDTGTEQLSRGFVFDFGEETSIDELKPEDGKVKSAVYDLSGRRVQKAQKGVYIQNGKVVLVR